MRLKKTVTALAMFIAIGFSSSMVMAAGTQHQSFDPGAFIKLSKQTIGLALKEKSPDTIRSNALELVEMGKAGCKEHMGEPETPASEKKLMELVLQHADGMSKLSLSDIEAKWHEGGVVTAAGIDLESFDHFSEVLSHFDSLVHPATVVICVDEYKKSGDPELMAQIVDELKEVVEHMKHLE